MDKPKKAKAVKPKKLPAKTKSELPVETGPGNAVWRKPEPTSDVPVDKKKGPKPPKPQDDPAKSIPVLEEKLRLTRKKEQLDKISDLKESTASPSELAMKKAQKSIVNQDLKTKSKMVDQIEQSTEADNQVDGS